MICCTERLKIKVNLISPNTTTHFVAHLLYNMNSQSVKHLKKQGEKFPYYSREIKITDDHIQTEGIKEGKPTLEDKQENYYCNAHKVSGTLKISLAFSFSQ